MSYFRCYPTPAPVAGLSIPITLTRVAASTDNIASFGVPFAEGVVSETKEITCGGRSLYITPTLYWYSAAGVATSIKAARVQIVMTEDSLAITLNVGTPVANDWPLASAAWSGVSHALTHSVPVCDYTIEYTGGVYSLEETGATTEDLFATREPCVYATFADGYLAGTGLFGPLLTATQVAADSSLAGVKYLSDAIEPLVRSGLYLPGWTMAAAAVPADPLPVESYLYDRPATILLALAHTNDPDFILPAYRYAWYYASLVRLTATPTRGIWTGKAEDDSKYSHARALYYYYALTGDTDALAAITAVADLWETETGTSVQYQAGTLPSTTATWTERELACALEGTFYGFLATGTASYLTAFGKLLDTAYTHISTSNQTTLDTIIKPGTPAEFPPQNAWIHNGNQQDETTGTQYPWVSTWMSELVVAPLLAYQAQSGDTRIDEIFIRLGRFIRDTGISYLYTGDDSPVTEDFFMVPSGDASPVGYRRAVTWYGAGVYADTTRYTNWNDDTQHALDTTALTACAERSLKLRPELDAGQMSPFATELACFKAIHHEMSYTAKAKLITYDYLTTHSPTGSYHTQGRLATAYAGGAPGIAAYVADNDVGYPQYTISPQRKLSWWLNNSIFQFGLMQEAAFALPTIITGWVPRPTAYTQISLEDVTASTGIPALITAYRAEAVVDTGKTTWFPTSVNCADFAGTGRPDLIFGNHSVAGSRIFTCTGYDANNIPQYADYTKARLLPASPYDFYAPFSDGSPYILDWGVPDGHPDILYCSDEYPTYVAVNNGSGEFTINSYGAIDTAQCRITASPTTGRADIMGVYAQYYPYEEHINNGDGTYTQGLARTHGEWGEFTTPMRLASMTQWGTVTFSNASGILQCNFPACSLRSGRIVRFRTVGAGVLPTGISADTDYYVVGPRPLSQSTPYFQLALTYTGAKIVYTDAGTATIECYYDCERPSCRTVDLGATIGEVVLVQFGQASDLAPDRKAFVIQGDDVNGWTDITESLGLPHDEFMFFAGVYDFNGDGLLDLLITDNDLGGIYYNNGDGTFTLRSDELAADIAAHSTQEGTVTLSDIADFNEDGHPEILLAQYRYGYYSRLYQYVSGQYVRAYTFPTGSQQFVVTDLNNDGRLDIAACVNGSPEIRVFLNRTPAAGNWININLTGPSTNLLAVDALIKVYTAGHLDDAGYLLATVLNNTYGAPVHLSLCGVGHSVGNKRPIHVGLGTASSVDIRVTYPSGSGGVTALAQTTDQTITMTS